MFSLISGIYKSIHQETKVSILLVGCDGAGKTTVLERCKVTDLKRKKPADKNSSKAPRRSSSNGSPNYQGASAANGNTNSIDKQRHAFCPAPSYYRHTVVLDEEIVPSNNTPKQPKPSSIVKTNDYLREGAKMLPLHLIRPTAGMNLGKVEAFGCKCSFWDLGGRESMRPLWERYYSDTDAIAFIVDITSSPAKMDEARKVFHSLKNDEQLAGVPILIFANKMDALNENDKDNTCDEYDNDADEKKTSNSPPTKQHMSIVINDLIRKLNIFPPEQQRQLMMHNLHSMNGFNDDGDKDLGIIDLDASHLIRLCYGSAKTGAGVRDAFEWLILTARDQILRS